MQVSEQSYLDGGDSFVTLRHLRIRGTNFEIGQKVAEVAIERYGGAPVPLAVNADIVRARRAYFQRSYPIHWERVLGVAAAFGVDPEDDRYDLTNLWHNLQVEMPAMGGCSVVYYPPATTAGERGYLSRNLDFPMDITIADIMQSPLPAETKQRMSSIFCEPYLMEWYPEDGGYASLAIHAFDTLNGTLDGINSAGLVVSQMTDETAVLELGPNLEFHTGPPHAVGMNELHLLRFLLDTCATADEAKEALLTSKQYYGFAPPHFIVADKHGNSFIYENSTGRNMQHVIDGQGQPQIVTNFQIHKYSAVDQLPKEPPTWENNAFWRYQVLAERIAEQRGLFSADDVQAINACVNYMTLIEEMRADPAHVSDPADDQVRTLYYGLYDQQAGTAEFNFYLGETEDVDGKRSEKRSENLKFTLKT